MIARLVMLSPAVWCACGAQPLIPADGGAVPDAGSPSPFASRVVSFDAGGGAGFGQNKFPDIVLGGPEGAGDGLGSYDVLSLGNGGEIVLGFDGRELIDGPGDDLVVFENPFFGFVETGIVAVSEDGTTWKEWPCAADDPDAGFPGCAGVHPVYANAMNGIPATSPDAGGDRFDLSAIGVSSARYVRVRDSGKNRYQPPSGGFDLDAIAIIHAR